MLPFPVPTFEQQRLEVLQRYRVLSPLALRNATELAAVAAVGTGQPIVCAAMTERHRGRFSCWHGPATLREAIEAFCARANLSDSAFAVPDAAADPHFADHPVVTDEPGVRGFAGAPIVARDGERLGTLCVLGPRPTPFGPNEALHLETLAALASEMLTLGSAARYAVQDLIEAERIKRCYYDLAMTDGLTGALNRRAFHDVARRDLARCARHGGDLAVIALDVDHFKAVNDVHGHAVGDAVLRELCACISRSVRDEDALGRLGGEEFAITLPETGEVAAHALADRLRRTVRQLSFEGRDGSFRVTVSMGVAAARPGERSLTAPLKRADAALYQAKAEGRDRVVREAA